MKQINDRKTLHLRWVWHTFIRLLIGMLVVLLGLALFLGLYPGALRAFVRILPVPGVVDIPEPGSTLSSPTINAPPGELPGGYRVFHGTYPGGSFGCTFLLELTDGRQVGIGAAHATPILPAGIPAELWTPENVRVASLSGEIGRGKTFLRANFTTDFVFWAVAETVDARYLLRPDSRGQAQPGEDVVVLTPFADNTGKSRAWPGVVMETNSQATWIQLDDSFDPYGLSGCPVVSIYTGQVIGMAVAGENKPPVVMGLNPIGSLVEKAQAALLAQP